MKKLQIQLFTLMLVFMGCKTGNEITVVNLASLYQPETRPIIRGQRVFIENDSVARVFVLYNTSDLTFERPPDKARFFANVRFSYLLFDNYESNKLIDSASFRLIDSVHYKRNKFLVFDFHVKIKPASNQLLNLYFTDLNNRNKTITPIEIQNLSAFGAQRFLPLDSTGNVIFNPWIPGNFPVQIICNNTKQNKLFVSFYKRSYPPALPPFSTSESSDAIFPADRTFTIMLDELKTELINPDDKGIYLFRNDSAANEGFTLFRFDDEYPVVTRAELMIFPLRYLCSNAEFEKITQSQNPEWAIGDFWLEAGGIDERAAELRREYSGRVVEANSYFTSYKEGWKTDRGMIYLIFGKPTTVYRRTGLETWIYSQQGNRVSLNFDFYQNENPFTNNDFRLKRLPEYKTPWFQAVDYWRR